MYIKSFIINCIFSESLSTHNATIKRSSAESDIKWTLCGKRKKLFLGQDAIKTTNTTEKEEVEAGKDGVEVYEGLCHSSLFHACCFFAPTLEEKVVILKKILIL